MIGVLLSIDYNCSIHHLTDRDEPIISLVDHDCSALFDQQ